jgi:hypothetical protein
MLFAWDAVQAGTALRAAMLGTGESPWLGLAGLCCLFLPPLFLGVARLWAAAEAAQQEDWRTDAAAGLAGMGTARLGLCAAVTGVVGLLFALIGLWVALALGAAAAAGLWIGAAGFLGFSGRCIILVRAAARRRRPPQRKTSTRI